MRGTPNGVRYELSFTVSVSEKKRAQAVRAVIRFLSRRQYLQYYTFGQRKVTHG